MSYIEPDFKKYAAREYGEFGSRFGERGLVKYLMDTIDKTSEFTDKPPYLVEIGVHPYECNTLSLIQDEKWEGIWIDAEPKPVAEIDGYTRFPIQEHIITTDNINPILAKNEVPWDFDLFSLDIDGNDYWIWKMMVFPPRVVIIEYNPHLTINESKVIAYHERFQWRGDRFYGASLKALNKLGIDKGYTLVCAYAHNAVFIRNDCIDNPEDFKYEEIYEYFPVHPFSTPNSILEENQEWIDV
jgi:hypothetical protein